MWEVVIDMCDRQALKEALLSEMGDEYERARKKFKKFNSRHEGYGVILEELDEAWNSIKLNELNAKLEPEIIQVGAMCLRFLIDIVYDCSMPTKKGEESD